MIQASLYCYAERDRQMVLIEASSAGWKETGRFTIPRYTHRNRKKGHIWTHPVIADGKLFLRDQDLIFCFEPGTVPLLFPISKISNFPVNRLTERRYTNKPGRPRFLSRLPRG